METLELWKTLLQKMSTNPKMYELSSYSKYIYYIIFINSLLDELNKNLNILFLILKQMFVDYMVLECQ